MGFTVRELAKLSGVSERFLVSIESGKGNVSVLRLEDVAVALGTTAASLLAEQAPAPSKAASCALSKTIVLIGLRGAGKSSIGAQAAVRLGVPFVELDARISERAGMSAGEIFDLHGAAHYRKLEREELERLLSEPPCVVATAGSLVTDHATFERILARTTVVFLRASAADHFARVVAQGDTRPMANRSDAMHELDAILRARRPLYERAHHVVDTTALGLPRSIDRVIKLGRAV
jgi:XRE family transcriptional regulator, aerobic/anaerobic benzoate catabolism transcriptional regulator